MGVLGFVGLGVMGEPMCRNLARKSGHRVIGLDRTSAPLERLAADGVAAAGVLGELATQAEIVFLSLPGGAEVGEVCDGADGLVALLRAGQTLVDLGTSPVALARAPVARTREAAIAGTLSIMVDAERPTLERLRPLLATMATDVTHCGAPGAGQFVKIMNNAVLAQTVVALAEALAAARAHGVDGKLLFETLARGSADSFALRNHGMKAMLPGEFPERAFSVAYMLKDVRYALELAQGAGLDARGARTALA